MITMACPHALTLHRKLSTMLRYVLQSLLSSVCWDGSFPLDSEADIGLLARKERWMRSKETRANPYRASRDELPAF